MKLSNLILFSLIILLTLYTFIDLPRTFFQQDEWQTLGHNLVGGIGVLKTINPFILLFGEVRPFSFFIYLIFLGFYKFSVVPAAVFAIFLHTINAFLVFYLTYKISKNKIVAGASSLFFTACSVSHQALTWVSAIATLPAATLILVSIIFYFKFLERPNKKFLAISFISAILSIYFKGTGIFLFLLLPIILYIFNDKSRSIRKIIHLNFPFLVFVSFMVITRIAQLFLRTNGAGYLPGVKDNNFIPTLMLHAVLYPLTSFFQVFVPPVDLYAFARSITPMQYKFLIGSPVKDLVAESVVTDMISVLGASLILILLVLIVNKAKDKIVNKNIIFALVFFVLSFLTYVALNRDASYLSSRYFYVGVIPAGILFGYVIYFFASINRYLKWTVFLFVFIFLLHHANIIRSDILYQVNLGDERRAVLNDIKVFYPNLEKDSIFYVTGDKKYYGEITNPFQNGLGYVLQVWYYDSGRIPKENLSENFLWDLGVEGYKSNGKNGFGYYQDLDKMISDMEKYRLSPNIVHAYFIRSSDMKILNITNETRTKISTLSAFAK